MSVRIDGARSTRKQAFHKHLSSCFLSPQLHTTPAMQHSTQYAAETQEDHCCVIFVYIIREIPWD